MGVSNLLKKITNRDGGLTVPEETSEVLINPDRGFYLMFSFDVTVEPDFSVIVPLLVGKETLVLASVNIGACAEREIYEEELDRISRILQFFREQRKDVILRVAYDIDGKAMDVEPPMFSDCLEHISQIGDLLRSSMNNCFIFQGLLVGNWGEMHSSRYTSKDRLKSLATTLSEKSSGSTYLSVRKPVQWREINGGTAVPGQMKMGLFNDGLFGSITDLGTYNQDECPTSAWNVPWSRSVEMDFMNKLCEYAPNGGEAVFGEGYVNTVSPDSCLNDMASMHLTYLNRQYDTKILDFWRDKIIRTSGIWNGKSIFEYIGAHLGYRFVIKSISIKNTNTGLKSKSAMYSAVGAFVEIGIANDGFAKMYRDCDLYICLGDEIHTVYGAMNTINPGETKIISSSFRSSTGKLKIYARRSFDDRPVFFANVSEEDGSIVFGELKGKLL